MEEKEIIRGKSSSTLGTLFLVLGLIGIPLMLLGIFVPHGIAISILGILLLILGIIMYMYVSQCVLVVTDKRVYGRAAFGKRVDLPLDSISAVSLSSVFDGIGVSTSAGRISFVAIKNSKEIQKEISELLIERQKNGNQTTTTIQQELPQSNADEIEKFKNLLDKGVITQEEFDAKKKQLLGL